MDLETRPLRWRSGKLEVIDQRYLPHEKNWIEVKNLEDTYEVIELMVVRGAPLIGFTALFGLCAHYYETSDLNLSQIKKDCEYLVKARPTAVNLSFELNRVVSLADSMNNELGHLNSFAIELEKMSVDAVERIRVDNLTMARYAEKDLKEKYGDKKLRLMTLCNTGSLACGPMGTALGVIEHMVGQNSVEHVYASETRPYLQGSRLTAYELELMEAPYSITVEGAFSFLLKNKLVDAVFIGADRVAANGDTANKVGSSTLAIVCNYYKIPFYVVAPTSSFDLETSNGEGIEIEMRDNKEILEVYGKAIAPVGSNALNPSFDITDANHIEGIICEKGFIGNPDMEKVKRVVGA